MKYLKMFPAALAVLALSACVGFVVPFPSGSSTGQNAEQNEKR